MELLPKKKIKLEKEFKKQKGLKVYHVCRYFSTNSINCYKQLRQNCIIIKYKLLNESFCFHSFFSVRRHHQMRLLLINPVGGGGKQTEMTK